MLTTSLSDGFSGFTTTLLESLRDEFPKSTVFTTGMIDSSRYWVRQDTEVRQSSLSSYLPSSSWGWWESESRGVKDKGWWIKRWVW